MIIAIVPVKSESKRLPNKNMIIMNGKHLIEYTINYIKISKRVDDFYVSTDSDKVEEYCIENNIKIIRRTEDLGGETPLLDVYKDAMQKIKEREKIQILCGVQVDHPDRKISLDQAIKTFEEQKVDRLLSKERNGQKNGAHYILSNYFLNYGTSRRDYYLVDDCTNIHYYEDLIKAEKNLKKYEENS